MSPLYLIFVALLVGRAQAAAPEKTGVLTFKSRTTTSIVMNIEEQGGSALQTDQSYQVERVVATGNVEVLALTDVPTAPLNTHPAEITDGSGLSPGTEYEYKLTIVETSTKDSGTPVKWSPTNNFKFATQQIAPVITFQSATPTSITSKFTVFDNYDEGHSYSITGDQDVSVAAEEFTISGLEPATMIELTAKGKKLTIESEVSDAQKLCTSPLAATVTEETRSGTDLTLKVKTGEGKTTGLFFDFSEDVSSSENPVTDPANVGTFEEAVSGNKDSWKLPLAEPATASVEVTAVFKEVPEGATYKVLPYYEEGSCPAAKYSSSFANKVSLEAMFVYGVVGLMALILRALGLDFCGWF